MACFCRYLKVAEFFLTEMHCNYKYSPYHMKGTAGRFYYQQQSSTFPLLLLICKVRTGPGHLDAQQRTALRSASKPTVLQVSRDGGRINRSHLTKIAISIPKFPSSIHALIQATPLVHPIYTVQRPVLYVPIQIAIRILLSLLPK